MGGIFGSKPSNAHVIWRNGRDDDGKKKFDFEYLELWAAHFGVDYEEWERTDHERGDELRNQYAVVFRWSSSGGQQISLGDTQWTMGTKKTPRTFLEIDELGMVRLNGWTSEAILDVDELVLDGTTFKLRTNEGETKSLDVRKLTARPEPNER